MPIVDNKRCPRDHSCPAVRVCPVKAIKQQGYAAPIIDQSLCTECGKCVSFCPMGAIQSLKKK
ncbi:MAG: 4Fe-4S binding protein [Candidatus Margulisbacteria bacterium]|nr:4Fe-4S binding protein [Candidatus Margulisiibacteriota bacterium]MBU1616763.1 4Fe-4S binding protein [Candidatus Margulisiibacteriota bacterium]